MNTAHPGDASTSQGNAFAPSRNGIVLAGTVVLDIVNIIERWPDEEQISFIQQTIHAPGGPPHNAAASLLKLKAPFPVSMIGIVGDDSYGDIFMEKARDYGIDTALMHRATGLSTDYTHVMTSAATGKRTFFFHPGANNTLTAQQLLPPDDAGKIFYLGSPGISTSMDASDGWRSVLRTVRKRGYKTCMELCPVPAQTQQKYVRPCLPLLDYFIVNDSEAEIVSGLPVLKNEHFDYELAKLAAQKFLAMGVGELAAIHHPEGAFALRSNGETICAPSVNVPQTEIIGSVGAGDAFYAGMLFGLHEDWSLTDCLALANASAATSLHSPTTSASIRPWKACLDYAKAKGLRRTAEGNTVDGVSSAKQLEEED